MQTFSHVLTTAWIGDRIQRRRRVRFKALLLGSFLPDLPLLLLTLWFFYVRSRLNPVPGGRDMFGPIYDRLYFHDPVWITLTSLFHAPVLILLMLAAGAYATRAGRRWGESVTWFAFGCGLHTVADIFTHHGDGPVLLFPFNLHYRFSSPISYWQPAYHGHLVGTIELGLDLLIAGYFVTVWLRRRLAGPPGTAAELGPDLGFPISPGSEGGG
ncbi:MAG: metal-dependent hydrolase [Gemmatimonadota bacterium]